MRLIFQRENGESSIFFLDIEDKLDHVDSISDINHDCTWDEYLRDRIEDIVDECVSESLSDEHLIKIRQKFNEYYPQRPVGV